MDQSRLALLLRTLYSTTDNTAIQEASSELNAWQQTMEAWGQADQLLSTPGLQAEFYYFFAQTIKTKIQFDMYQLQPNAFISLRDSVVQKLLSVAHNSAAKPTRRQLCLALADLTIQAVEMWETAIPDLVNLLQSEHPLELLEILKLIPEVTENLKLMTETGKRNLSRQHCLQYYSSVLELLNSKFAASSSPDVTELVLGCFLSWLKFDSPPIQYSLADSPVVNFCLAELNKVSATDLSVNDTAVEILVEIVESSASYRNRHQHNPLIELKVFPQISALCQSLLRANLEDFAFSDADSLKLITRLLVVTGEGMMNQISSEYLRNSRVQEFIVVVIKIFALRNIELSDTCCPFLEDFLQATAVPGRSEASNLHDTLFEATVVRMDVKTEPSFDGTDPFGSVDRDFFHFRSQSLVPLLYKLSRDFLSRAVGAERLVRGLIHNAVNGGSLSLQEAFAVAVKDQLSGVPEISASLQSATDFLIDSLPQWIDVSSIHSCSLVDAFRRRSLIAVVGSLPAYIKSEQQLFRAIDAVAQVLIRPVVVHRSLHVAAATAFRELCFHSHTRGMIVVNQNAIESITRLFSQTAGHLDMHEHSQVTEGITTVLSVCPEDNLFNSLISSMIMMPPIQTMQSARAAADVTNAGLAIDRLTAVVRSIAKMRPGSSRYNTVGDIVLRSMWPALAAAMETFRSEAELIEKACRLVKHTLRCVPDVFKQLLVPLGQLLVRDFNACQHSSYLYTAEVLVQEFGQDVDVREALTDLFSRLATDGGRIVQQRMTAQAFGQDSVDELIEDLFGMMERFLRYSPTIVVKSRAAVITVIGLVVPVFARITRRGTIEAVSAFTEEIFAGQWTHSVEIGTVTTDDVMAIRVALVEIAPVLVQELFSLLVTVCTRPMRHAIPSLLMTLHQFDENAFRNDWVIRGLQRVPASVMTDRDKQAAASTLCNPEDERAINACVEDILYRSELVGRRMRNEQGS